MLGSVRIGPGELGAFFDGDSSRRKAVLGDGDGCLAGFGDSGIRVVSRFRVRCWLVKGDSQQYDSQQAETQQADEERFVLGEATGRWVASSRRSGKWG